MINRSIFSQTLREMAKRLCWIWGRERWLEIAPKGNLKSILMRKFWRSRKTMGSGVTTMGSNTNSNTPSYVNLNMSLLLCEKWGSSTNEILLRKLLAFQAAHELFSMIITRELLCDEKLVPSQQVFFHLSNLITVVPHTNLMLSAIYICQLSEMCLWS